SSLKFFFEILPFLTSSFPLNTGSRLKEKAIATNKMMIKSINNVSLKNSLEKFCSINLMILVKISLFLLYLN
ncbi:hypothetical protein, partial [Oenococcus oeni]|uniref:hypothetical protein n=2 Tax=Oenococcus oeni TaxID=1247 RepID=UPI001C5AE61A